MARATFTVHNENIAGLAVDTNETLEMFGGIGGLGSSSSLVHGIYDGTTMIESSTFNQFSFIIKISNCGRLGQIQYIVLYVSPMWVAKEIMLLCIIGNILRSILKEHVEGFPCGNAGRPEHFQVEGRTKIFLVTASQGTTMGSDTLKSASLQGRGKGLRRT